MDMLRERVANYTDDELLEVYGQRDEFTEEAVKIYEEEIARRGLLDETAPKAGEVGADSAALARRFDPATGVYSDVREDEADVAKTITRNDFIPLPGFFTKADVLTANTVLHDSKVPYAIEERIDANDADEGRCDSDRVAKFNVIVYKDAFDTALGIIGEHFEVDGDGRYVPVSSDIVDRLKAFSLSDIRISDKAARERIDVDFSEAEKNSLVKLAKALIDEADAIEERQERPLFFYDAMDTLVEDLESGKGLTRTDFLAIIELCQVYCEDARYDAELNQVASSILSFFLD